MKKQVLLGTTNGAKINIVRAAVESLLVEVLTPRDLDIDVDVREDGRSTEENAEKKARAYFAQAHMPTMAIDGGLHIEAFDEERQPGVFVKRIPGAHDHATDEEILDYYVRELAKIGGESVGVWKGSITLITSDGRVFSESFSFESVLTCRQKGDLIPGSPLDVMMVDPASGKYYSEMGLQERPDFAWIAEFVGRHVGEL